VANGSDFGKGLAASGAPPIASLIAGVVFFSDCIPGYGAGAELPESGQIFQVARFFM
jgi:hypothetical protein